MFTEIEVIAFSVLAFGLGIALTIVASFVNQRGVDEFNAPQMQITDLDKRASPLIKIHNSIMEDDSVPVEGVSVSGLKDKIESFKYRNRFYQS